MKLLIIPFHRDSLFDPVIPNKPTPYFSFVSTPKSGQIEYMERLKSF